MFYAVCIGSICFSFWYLFFYFGNRRFDIEDRPSVYHLQDKPSSQRNASCPMKWERFGKFSCPYGTRTREDFQKCFTVPIQKNVEARNFLIRRYLENNAEQPVIRYIKPDSIGTFINQAPGHPIRILVMKSDKHGFMGVDNKGTVYIQRDVCNISSRDRY